MTRVEVFRVVVTRYPARPKNARHFTSRFPGKDFFWPNAERLYRSRSGAVARAQLLRWYGANVRVDRAVVDEWLEVPS